VDIGASLGFQNSSTVAADNSGIQSLGGGFMTTPYNAGNTANTIPTATQTTSTGVGATPATGSPTSQPSPSLLAPSSIDPSVIVWVLIGILVIKLLRS
jgi:type V secretory pathway adhesin AidA